MQRVSEGKCFAFLAGDLHLDMQLAKVRARLNAQNKELMPSSYQILYRNIPLSEKEESLLTLGLCMEQPDAATEMYVFHFSTPEQLTRISSNPQEKGENTEKSSNSKVDIFTDKEIFGQSCWLERERWKYWNCKVKELRVSKEVANYGKTELIGVIDTAWTLKKAELLQIRASQLQVMHERLKTVYNNEYQSLNKKSNHILSESTKIFDNTELISKTVFFIQNENRCLSNENVES